MIDPLLTRRRLLQSTACGFGYLALAGLAQTASASNPLAPKTPHHRTRAKRVIFIFMQGGPSQVDTFDYKPRLAREDGQMRSFDDARTFARTRSITTHRVMKSPWRFRQYGGTGGWVSEPCPRTRRHV